MKPLEKSFWEEAGELVHLEGMLSKALLRMHSVAHAESLKQLLAKYRLAGEQNLEALSQTFRIFDVSLREKKNETAMALFQKVQQLILRTRSGPVLDTLLLALCLKTIALKTQSYGTIASWAQSLNPKHRDLTATLQKLYEAEKRAFSDFGQLAPECDLSAAAEVLEMPRPRERTVKVPKEQPRARGNW